MTPRPGPKPTFAQYCRVENDAGGAYAHPRRFIRAARYLLTSETRNSRQHRASRHYWMRELLKMREHSQVTAQL